MAARPAILKCVKWSLAFALGLQVLIALLLFGKYPFLFRGGIYSQARGDREGMRLAVYDNLNRSGPAEARFTPDASARLAVPHTSLEGYGIWQVKKAGTYTLVLHCDDYGSLFLDGHPYDPPQGNIRRQYGAGRGRAATRSASSGRPSL